MEPTHFESLYPANTRQNEIAKILSFIKEGSSCQVISLPGGGRSNLLGLLTYNRNVRIRHFGESQKWFHFVLCNFAEVRNKSLTETIKFLFLSLIDSIYARHSGNQAKPEHPESLYTLQGSVDVGDSGQARLASRAKRARMTEKVVNSDDVKTLKEIFSESIAGNDEIVLFQGLKRAIDFLAIEKELTTVFLFDRFEDYIPTVTPEFFTNLRVLRDRTKYRFAVVFSTYKPLEDLIGQDLLLDFYQFVAGHTVYLALLDKPGLDFRISYIEKASGKKLEKETIDSIIKVTAGHPNLTRLAIETVLETSLRHSGKPRQTRRIQNLSGGDVTAVRDSGVAFDRLSLPRMTSFFLSQKPIKSALFEIWKSLSPSEQKILLATGNHLRHSGNPAQRGHPESLPHPNPLPNPLPKGEGGVRVTDDENYFYLENVGLVKNNKITIPLFSQFVKQLGKESTHIAFDPNTLSDSLTSSEFKLLKYLLQNSQRIVEREEIINTVWANTKTTAGVTDQALDQLIFRVRKKIEDNPNSPSHLQTVKGRGIRFIA